MKILLLNQVFYPDVVATAQYLSDLAVALAEDGHEVTIVCARRAYEHPETLYQPRETWRGVNIIRVFSTRFGKKAKWRRAVDFASFLFCCCGRLLFLPRQDVVVALTTPPLISFIGAWRAKLWRANFCYWVMDMNPDEAIAAGWLRADSLAAKALERMSRFSFRRASLIIALDRFMRERIVAKQIDPKKIAAIPPWSQDDEIKFDATGREKFRRAHGLENKFVVMYSGNHSPVHSLETLMATAEMLQDDPTFHFVFVGGGSEFKRVKQWADNRERPNVLCLPYQPLKDLSASLSAADAHVVVMGNAMLGLVHPCKIYNIFAVGAPVVYIGPEPSHVTEILDQPGANYPWCSVRHGETAKLAAQLREMQSRSAERQYPASIIMPFAKNILLPRLIAGLEK